MYSILMRSLATVSMKICSNFAVIIAQTVLILMNSKKRFDLSKSKTIRDLKYQNSLWRLIHMFPFGRFDFDAFSTQNLLESVHRVVNVKMHCHHSNVTGKILGYAHNFSNVKVRKSESVFLYCSQLF